MFSLPKGRK
jgi:hypothetical protein